MKKSLKIILVLTLITNVVIGEVGGVDNAPEGIFRRIIIPQRTSISKEVDNYYNMIDKNLRNSLSKQESNFIKTHIQNTLKIANNKDKVKAILEKENEELELPKDIVNENDILEHVEKIKKDLANDMDVLKDAIEGDNSFKLDELQSPDKLSSLESEKARQDMIKYMNANRPSNDPLCLEPDKLSFAGKQAQKLAESGGQDLSSLLHTNYFPKTSTYGKTYGPYEVIKQDMKEQITCEPIVKEEHKCVGIGFNKEAQDTQKQVENVDKQIQDLENSIKALESDTTKLDKAGVALKQIKIKTAKDSIADLQKKKADFQKFQGDKYAYWSQVFGKEDDCFCVYDKVDKRCEPNAANIKETYMLKYNNEGSTGRDDPKGKLDWNKENGINNPCYNPINGNNGLEDKRKEIKEKMKNNGATDDELKNFDKFADEMESRQARIADYTGDINKAMQSMDNLYDNANSILDSKVNLPNGISKVGIVNQMAQAMANPNLINQNGPTCSTAGAIGASAHNGTLGNYVSQAVNNADKGIFNLLNAGIPGDLSSLNGTLNNKTDPAAKGKQQCGVAGCATWGAQIAFESTLEPYSNNTRFDLIKQYLNEDESLLSRPGYGMTFVNQSYNNLAGATNTSDLISNGAFDRSIPGHIKFNYGEPVLVGGEQKFLYANNNTWGGKHDKFYLSDKPLTAQELANLPKNSTFLRQEKGLKDVKDTNEYEKIKNSKENQKKLDDVMKKKAEEGKMCKK